MDNRDAESYKKLMEGLGKMLSDPDNAEDAFNEMFKDQIAESENAPQMPDVLDIEYTDGTKERLVRK
jgi:hypothetical protein